MMLKLLLQDWDDIRQDLLFFVFSQQREGN